MSRWIVGIVLSIASVVRAQTPSLSDDTEARTAAKLFEAVRPDPPATSQGRSLAVQPGNIDPRITAMLSTSTGRSLVVPAVRAIIEAQTAAVVPAITTRLARLGIADVVSFENVLYATVPVTQADTIANWPGVRSLRIQDEFAPAQTRPSSNAIAAGMQRIGLEALQKRSLTGKGVRIGILDNGFQGLQELIDSRRVRPPADQQAFPASHGVQNRERHGAACAEIISGIAPGAELYLASFDGYEGSLIAAAKWLISKGVRIISYSGGNPSAPSDGTDPLSRFIDRSTAENNVLWIVSSGNTGNRHWSGLAVDRNHDGWIDIHGQSPYLTIVSLEPKVSVTVRWNDWGVDPRRPKAAQDIDVQLVELNQTGERTRVVAQSSLRQQGPAARPVEWLRLEGKVWVGRRLAVMLQPVRMTRPVLVHVFVESDAQMFPRTPERSVLSPSAAPMAVSVGGFDIVREQLAVYSAQGPTDDERLKPELVAPTNVPSRTYVMQGGRFAGTSASSPHASGLAALLAEQFHPASAMQLRTLLLQSSKPEGDPSPNTLFGYGQLNASRARPGPAITQPRSLGTETVTLSDSFGGSISFRQLDRLREAPLRQDLFTARVTTDRTLYGIGDAIRVSYSANTRAECALLYRDVNAVYTVLVPGGRLDGVSPGVFPPADEVIRAGGPAGEEELLLLCVSSPVELSAVNPDDLSPEIAVSRAIFHVIPPFL